MPVFTKGTAKQTRQGGSAFCFVAFGQTGVCRLVFSFCVRLTGKRLPADRLFPFGVKKEPKNRHRFDAVDADQGCGPGPGECGHLTTAYSGPGGPEQGMDLKSLRES